MPCSGPFSFPVLSKKASSSSAVANASSDKNSVANFSYSCVSSVNAGSPHTHRVIPATVRWWPV